MIFEYLAYNNVPIYLLTFGLIGIIVFFILMNEYKNAINTKFFKRLKICFIISVIWFLCGIFLPSENYYEKKNKRLEVYREISNDVDKYIDYKLEKIKSDISFIKEEIYENEGEEEEE